MERLQRALDLARQERLGAAQLAVAVAGATASGAVARFPVPAPFAAEGPSGDDGTGQPRAPHGIAATHSGAAAHAEARVVAGDAGAAAATRPDGVAGAPTTSTSTPFPAVLSPCFAPALRARHVVMPEDRGAASHAYRMLRTQLLQRAAARGASAIGVVSAADGEGKTLTALNLALSIAADPERNVLLADFDLRRPALASLLSLTPARGLESWFEAVEEPEPQDADALCMGLIGVPRLALAPTFAPVPRSSERLGGNRTRRLLQSLRRRAAPGLLLLDLPPVLLGDDVLALAPMLDGVLLVASERRTRRDDVLRLQQLLAGVPVLGAVLNASAESERRAY